MIKKIQEYKFIKIFANYFYYTKICRVASIFGFYTAAQFLDFESTINKTGFNYIDYSVERLGVYGKLFIDKNI